MTVKAEVTSTLNGQSVELVLVEKSPSQNEPSYERKSLGGGTETFIFTSLDGGRDKEYHAKVVPSTTDVTQTAEVNFGATVRIDPIPHRDVDADQVVRDDANFDQGVGAQELGLGEHTLVGGLLTTALNDGEVLADDGYVYSTVQAAQDAASSWIFIGPGTFNESVTVDTAGLSVVGSGYNTLIDGGTTGNALSVEAADTTVTNISVRTGAGSGNSYDGITSGTNGTNGYISNIWIRDSDRDGINIVNGSDWTMSSIVVEAVDRVGLLTGVPRSTLSGCIIRNADSNNGISMNGDDSIVSNSIVIGAGNHGIGINQDDIIVIGNRVHNSADNGINAGGSTNVIIANNRVSGSTNSDIDTSNATGSITDDNLTGAAN